MYFSSVHNRREHVLGNKHLTNVTGEHHIWNQTHLIPSTITCRTKHLRRNIVGEHHISNQRTASIFRLGVLCGKVYFRWYFWKVWFQSFWNCMNQALVSFKINQDTLRLTLPDNTHYIPFPYSTLADHARPDLAWGWGGGILPYWPSTGGPPVLDPSGVGG